MCSGLAPFLSEVNEHFSNIRITDLCIKHCVIEVALGPLQLKVSLHKRGAIAVNRVDFRYCLFLRRSRCDQSVNLKRAGSIEERSKDILAIAKKILRTPANDYAWAARKRVIDRMLGNSGDAARIEQFQPVGWRQASLECSPRKDWNTR